MVGLPDKTYKYGMFRGINHQLVNTDIRWRNANQRPKKWQSEYESGWEKQSPLGSGQ